VSGNKQRAVFLDRDGVINRAVIRAGKPYPPASVEELDVSPEVRPALQALCRAGFLLIGATNQPDVARGITARETVEAINHKLITMLPIREILVCYHDDRDHCDCRKPKPGLLLLAAARYSIDVTGSFMIGDRWRDIEAGRRAGCTSIWIDGGYAEAWPVAPPERTVHSLAEAVAGILKLQKGETQS